MLSAGLGQSVVGKTVPSVLSTALGLWPRAVLETSDTVTLLALKQLESGPFSVKNFIIERFLSGFQ